MKHLITVLATVRLLLPAHAGGAEAPIGGASRIDAGTLAAEAIHTDGQLVGAWRIDDHHGAHILVLTRKAGPSPTAPRSGRVEKIDLTAIYYRRSPVAQWQQEWTVRDGSDCPGLDVDGGFFKDSVTFTDLNRDRRTEVTIPYHLFCGGGVDPRSVKVILREGSTKLAVRGESLVRYPGQPPFGGEYRHDKALLAPARARYKTHVDAVWRTVVDDRRR